MMCYCIKCCESSIAKRVCECKPQWFAVYSTTFCKQQRNGFWDVKECSKGVWRVWKSYRGAVSAITPVLLNWVGSLRNASMKILHFQEIQSGVPISSFRGLREQETRPPRQKLTASPCLKLPPNPKYLNFTLNTSSTRAQSIIDKLWSIQTQSSLRNTVKSMHYIFCSALEFPSNFISIPASFLPAALPFISPHVSSCHSQALICLSQGWIICSCVVPTGLRCHAGLPRCAWLLAESHARKEESKQSRELMKKSHHSRKYELSACRHWKARLSGLPHTCKHGGFLSITACHKPIS